MGAKKFQETNCLLSALLYLIRSMPGNRRPRFLSPRINKGTENQEEEGFCGSRLSIGWMGRCGHGTNKTDSGGGGGRGIHIEKARG